MIGSHKAIPCDSHDFIRQISRQFKHGTCREATLSDVCTAIDVAEEKIDWASACATTSSDKGQHPAALHSAHSIATERGVRRRRAPLAVSPAHQVSKHFAKELPTESQESVLRENTLAIDSNI